MKIRRDKQKSFKDWAISNEVLHSPFINKGEDSMEKQIFINNAPTNFWIEDTGRLRNQRTKRWLKGGINKGYHFYSLHFRGKQYIFYTHRLVAEYFIDNPDNLPIVQHIDNNRLNNLYTNLCWVSTEQHAQKVSQIIEKVPRPKRSYIDFNGIEMAQFRNSPYYLTRDGRVINVSKRIEVRPEITGNYLRFLGAYNLNNKHFLIHRAVWEAFNGIIPKGYDIDHVDGNPRNNALNNLELVTHKENIRRRNMDWTYVSDNFYHGE